jgi:hypothetical protein
MRRQGRIIGADEQSHRVARGEMLDDLDLG